MLGGILGRGFSSKCKSLIKPTRTRIDVLRRRKEATQRFLKSNLAQLLVNGHDMDAYGRTEEYLAELNLLSCYDFIEQSCVYILKQLSVMQKQSECPEECREAVGSLMFAAARFSDLPELRDLRDTFQERYGSSLEHFVSPKFVENLASRPSTVEKKIKLLEDVASEISIKWDSRGFEQRIANPSASAQPKKYGPIHDHCDIFKSPKDKKAITKIDKRREESSKERNELTSYKHGKHKSMEGNLLKREDLDHHFVRREDLIGKNHEPSAGSKQTIPKRENYDIAPRPPRREPTHGNHELFSSNGKEGSAAKSIGKRAEFVDRGYEVRIDRVGSANKYGQSHPANSTNKVQEEERDTLKPCASNVPPPPYIKSRDKLIPPPYIKSEDGRHGVGEESSTEPSTHKGENGVCGSERIRGESSLPKYDKDLSYQNDIPLPKPRSGRRKHSQPSSSSRDEFGNSVADGVMKGSSSRRRRDTSKTGLQILIDDKHHRKNEEEMAIDRLLLHYSKKPSTCEPEKTRRKSKKASNKPNNVEDEIDRPSTRSVSLPREQIAPAEASVKAYTHANSFQPDKPAGHVHPKLPDYDDLAAGLAALRGR